MRLAVLLAFLALSTHAARAQTTGPVNVTKVGGEAVTLGKKTEAASIPVTMASDQGAIPVTGTFYPATQPVSGTVAVSNLPVTQPVSGTVAVSNFPATQPISATALPLPSGAATEASLVAVSAQLPSALVSGRLDVNVGSSASLPVTGTFYQATQPVSGTVAVSNLPVTQPISASALPLAPLAATSTLQGTGNTSLSSLDTKLVLPGALDGSGYLKTHEQGTATVTGAVTVSDGSGALNVIVDSSALPSGAATDTLQTSGNATLGYINGKLPSALDGSGYLKTHEQGTATITGTVAATQSGTFTVQPGNTANTTAWKVDNSAVTQPIKPTSTQVATAPTSVSCATSDTLAFASAAGICSVTLVNLGTNAITIGQTVAVADLGPGLILDGLISPKNHGESVTFTNYGGDIYCIAHTSTTVLGIQPTACP